MIITTNGFIIGGIMEKKFRDYFRHLEKLDFDVISEEEIWEEREGLELRLSEIHREMVRILIPMAAFLICASIFLSAGFNGFFVGNFVLAAVMALGAAFTALRYKNMSDMVRQLSAFMEKLTIR